MQQEGLGQMWTSQPPEQKEIALCPLQIAQPQPAVLAVLNGLSQTAVQMSCSCDGKCGIWSQGIDKEETPEASFQPRTKDCLKLVAAVIEVLYLLGVVVKSAGGGASSFSMESIW